VPERTCRRERPASLPSCPTSNNRPMIECVRHGGMTIVTANIACVLKRRWFLESQHPTVPHHRHISYIHFSARV
jgi:hypothetical protein